MNNSYLKTVRTVFVYLSSLFRSLLNLWNKLYNLPLWHNIISYNSVKLREIHKTSVAVTGDLRYIISLIYYANCHTSRIQILLTQLEGWFIYFQCRVRKSFGTDFKLHRRFILYLREVNIPNFNWTGLFCTRKLYFFHKLICPWHYNHGKKNFLFYKSIYTT